MRWRVPVDALAFVLQLSVVGAMLGSLYAPADADQNAFVVGGVAAGAFVGWRARRADATGALFRWSLFAGAVCGALVFVPLARRLDDGVLVLSGLSLGLFLGVPMYALTLPAFFARRRATRAREGSIVRRADAMATWAASGVSIAVLGVLGQPHLRVTGRAVDLSSATVAFGTVVGIVVVASDLRAWRALAPASAAPRVDIGLGDDTVEEHIPASNPFRSAERIELLRVGDARAGRSALLASLALDAGSLVVCATVLVLRLRLLF